MKLPIPKDLVINFSGMIFLGVSGFLAWEQANLGILTTAKGLTFLIGGVLLAGMLIGWPINRLHRTYCARLIEQADGDLSPSAMQTIRYTGTFAMLLQLLVIYYLTAQAFRYWLL